MQRCAVKSDHVRFYTCKIDFGHLLKSPRSRQRTKAAGTFLRRGRWGWSTPSFVVDAEPSRILGSTGRRDAAARIFRAGFPRGRDYARDLGRCDYSGLAVSSKDPPNEEMKNTHAEKYENRSHTHSQTRTSGGTLSTPLFLSCNSSQLHPRRTHDTFVALAISSPEGSKLQSPVTFTARDVC